MIGITNAIKDKIKQAVLKYNDLICWLDGTDFLNHASNGNIISITNQSNNITLGNETIKDSINNPYYLYPNTNGNGLEITPYSEINPNNWTMTIWGKKLAQSNYELLCGFGISGGPAVGEIRIRNTNTNAFCTYIRTSGTSYQECSVTIGDTLSTWHHYALSFTPGTYKTYFDGVLSRTDLFAGNVQSVISRWSVLGKTIWNNNGNTTAATDFRFYNTTLSDEEIMTIYNAGPQQHK